MVSNLSAIDARRLASIAGETRQKASKGEGKAPAGVVEFANTSFYEGAPGGTVGLDCVSRLSSETHPQRMNRGRPNVPSIHPMSRNSSATFGGFVTGHRRSPRDQRSVMADQSRDNGL